VTNKAYLTDKTFPQPTRWRQKPAGIWNEIKSQSPYRQNCARRHLSYVLKCPIIISATTQSKLSDFNNFRRTESWGSFTSEDIKNFVSLESNSIFWTNQTVYTFYRQYFNVICSATFRNGSAFYAHNVYIYKYSRSVFILFYYAYKSHNVHERQTYTAMPQANVHHFPLFILQRNTANLYRPNRIQLSRQ